MKERLDIVTLRKERADLMPKKKAIEILRLDFHTGGWNRKTKKRLPNIPVGIYNRKYFGLKRSLFHKRRTVSIAEYKKTLNRIKKKNPQKFKYYSKRPFG